MYIITDDLMHDGYFYPRIPKHRLLTENDSTKRICLAKTIEGCLSSFPRGGSFLKNTLLINMNVLKVFKIIPEKLKLKKDSIKNEHELISDVSDAIITGENWITEAFQVDEEDTFYIYCHSWEEVIVKNKYNESITIIKDLDFDNLNELMTNLYYSFTLEEDCSLEDILFYLKNNEIDCHVKRDVLLRKNTLSFKTNDKKINISSFFKKWILDSKLR